MSADSSLSFHRLIPDPLRGDPFSHPSGSSAAARLVPFSNRKEPAGCPGLVPSGPVSWATFAYARRSLLSSRSRAPTSKILEARKYSVPGRVHSVYNIFGWSRGDAASNPLRTHGTVESPAKLSFIAQITTGRAAASNQSNWFSQPLYLAGDDSPKFMGTAFAPVPGTSAGAHRHCPR